MHKILFLLIPFFLVKNCDSNKITPLEKELQAEVNSIAANEMIPGISLGIVLPDDRVLKIVAGFSDKEEGKYMTGDDLLLSGSIGKTYVVPIVMNLIREEKLALNDLVSIYFEKEDWFKKIPNWDAITIEMLLSHTSGIPRYVFKPALWEIIKNDPEKEWTGKERLSFIFEDPPLHEPGKDWKYSDTNFIILGMIVEKITGRKYNDILESDILQPLKLNHTKPSRQPYIEGLAGGYTAYSERFYLPEKVTTNHRYAMNPQMEWTGGGVASSASDLARWAKYLYTGKVLTKDQIQKITSPSPFEAELPDNAQYGLGTFIWKNDGVVSYGHSGFMFGYVAIVEYMPELQISLALQINTDKLPERESLYGYLNRFKIIIKNNLKS